MEVPQLEGVPGPPTSRKNYTIDQRIQLPPIEIGANSSSRKSGWAASKSGGPVEFLKGVLLVAGSGIMFSFMAVLIKLAAKELPSFTIIFLSSGVRWTLLMVAVCLSLRGSCKDLKQSTLESPGLTLIGSLSAFIGFSCTCVAYANMPLGNASAILFSTPALAALLGSFLLKTPLFRIDMAIIGVTIVGALLVALSSLESDETIRRIAPLLAFIGSLGAAGVMTSLSMIRVHHGKVNQMVVIHAFALVTFVFSPVGMVSQEFPRSFVGVGALLAVGVGVLATAHQLMLINGLERIPTGLSRLLRITEIILSFMFQFFVFRDKLSALSIGGSILIVSCTCFQGLRQDRNEACAALLEEKDLDEHYDPLPVAEWNKAAGEGDEF